MDTGKASSLALSDWLTAHKDTALLCIALTSLLTGFVVRLSGFPDVAEYIWVAGVIPVLSILLIEIVRSLRKGEFGLDIVAALSMSAAMIFGEQLAAIVVALMYSGGTLLESFAEGRARREMSELLSHVPRTATRHDWRNWNRVTCCLSDKEMWHRSTVHWKAITQAWTSPLSRGSHCLCACCAIRMS